LSKVLNCLLVSTCNSKVMRIKTSEPTNRPIAVRSKLRGMGRGG